MGRYQVVTVIIWCTIGYLTGGLMLSPPYLFYEDPYVCGPEIANCKEYVCGLESGRGGFRPVPSMRTIANKFGDYRCPEEKMIIDGVITIMYVGNVVGFLFITLIGGLLGRKMLLIINIGIVVVGLLLVILAP